jgi:hypothetical protein
MTRMHRALSAAALVAAAASFAAPQASGQEAPRVAVQELDGVYVVEARFEVPQPPSVVLAVLTDYEGIPRFMPHVRSSIVRSRHEGGAVVEQEAVSRVLMFSKRVHLLLEVEQTGDALRFRDACGRSFTQYDGAWTVAEGDGRTVVTYELRARPSFDVPGFVLTKLLKRDSVQMIERLRAEMAAPGAQAADRP